MATKTKAKKAERQSGSAAYIRELCKQGLSKAQAFDKACKKFPLMAIANGKVHFDPRWDAANRINKLAAAKEKAA
jgi:hypothetical protein